MSESARMIRAAGVVGAATFLSRILGLVRDAAVAATLGAGMASDAFFVAFKIPNFLRRLFAEGSLTLSFIPVFTEELRNRGENEAFRLARSLWWALSMAATLLTIAGAIYAPAIARLLAPGFHASAEKFELTVLLTQIMSPYVFSTALVAVAMGVLNAMGHFASPALAPAALNVAIIISVWLICPYMEQPAIGLAIGVIVGGFLQLGLQLPFLYKIKFRLFGHGSIYHKAIKRVAASMMPAAFGADVYQINIMVGTILASFLPQGSVSCLYYGDLLVQFPLGVFGHSFCTAVLPSFSRQAAENDLQGLRTSSAHVLRLLCFVTIPATVGLVILRQPLVRLLFHRGAFDLEATRITADALLFYAVGLTSIAGSRILASAFYALQDTKTPVKLAALSFVSNAVLCFAFMGPMRHGGVAFATSLAAAINFLSLTWALKKRLGHLGARAILTSIGKSCLASIPMGASVACLVHYLSPILGEGFKALSIIVLGGVVAGIAIYGVCAYGLRCQELNWCVNMARTAAQSKGSRQ